MHEILGMIMNLGAASRYAYWLLKKLVQTLRPRYVEVRAIGLILAMDRSVAAQFAGRGVCACIS